MEFDILLNKLYKIAKETNVESDKNMIIALKKEIEKNGIDDNDDFIEELEEIMINAKDLEVGNAISFLINEIKENGIY